MRPDPRLERVKKKPQPEWAEPMLASLAADASEASGPGWLFEPKLDGIRCLAFRDRGELRLFSRNRLPLNAAYPELLQPLLAQRWDRFIVDGEVVALRDGIPSFSELQRRKRTPVPVYLFLFDLLHLEGHDLTGLPLAQRKRLLKEAFEFRPPLFFTSHRDALGEFFEEACRQGWEGLVAKRADSRYVPGRTGSWLKLKCANRQEVVVGGYTDPQGEREAFGALLTGYYDGQGRLVYAGKVGTGYSDQLLRRLLDRFRPLQRRTPPFERGAPPSAGVHWLEPKLVAEVGFTEWTPDGKLRHPRFLGLREDKRPSEVRREGTGHG